MGESSKQRILLTFQRKLCVPSREIHGLTDVETIANVIWIWFLTARALNALSLLKNYLRNCRYLDGQGFLKLKPCPTHEAGGAAARPFITHHNAQNIDMVLRIMTELTRNAFIVGGMERVYEIGRIFRNEGMDATITLSSLSIEVYCLCWLPRHHGLGQKALSNTPLRQLRVMVQSTTKALRSRSTSHSNVFRWMLLKEITGVDFWQDMSFEEAASLG